MQSPWLAYDRLRSIVGIVESISDISSLLLSVQHLRSSSFFNVTVCAGNVHFASVGYIGSCSICASTGPETGVVHRPRIFTQQQEFLTGVANQSFKDTFSSYFSLRSKCVAIWLIPSVHAEIDTQGSSLDSCPWASVNVVNGIYISRFVPPLKNTPFNSRQ